jgi:uncharacterized protein YndB with AHSA1/START domain
VPTARHSRIVAAPVQELWEVIRDPHHLPRWWPRVSRVENVDGDAFTEVMKTARGKVVRADFDLIEADEGKRMLKWEQRVENTPFARLLKSAETEVRLAPVAAPQPRVHPTEDDSPRAAAASVPELREDATVTEVTIELRQTLNGFLARLGSYMVRRAMAATLEEALDGLERISG